MVAVPNSILDSVKKTVGVDVDAAHFDTDIILHTNAAFSTLQQLGAGPLEGFAIEDNTTTWAELETDPILLSWIKQYVFFKVRLAFDPPNTSFAINAIESQIKEHEWRITVKAGGLVV